MDTGNPVCRRYCLYGQTASPKTQMVIQSMFEIFIFILRALNQSLFNFLKKVKSSILFLVIVKIEEILLGDLKDSEAILRSIFLSEFSHSEFYTIPIISEFFVFSVSVSDFYFPPNSEYTCSLFPTEL